MPSDNFTMSENLGSFGMQQRQDRFDAIGDLIVGPPGPPGPQGPPGADGTVSFDELTPAQKESLRGEGVPAGGTTGQVLAKSSNTDYATRWVDAGGNASLTILSYGHSTWADFIAAYNSRSIVYCRASSDSDPASGSQTRLAFMAYVNSAASPTSVEFQYYRSVSSHTDAQQGDQVFVYKLTSGGVWSVTVREAYTKIAAGTNMTSSYANGTLTLNATGGGGGTSDYDDLTDKPSINGTTLSGNKTAEDLGLGTYTKPSGGIPQTDLASAVQTSLGLADSALQSVPSTYRTAAAQDAIDAAQNGNLATIESSPATAAHAVGEYIVLNGQLYKVTAAIAAGQTLTVGTNIAAVSGGGLNEFTGNPTNTYITASVTTGENISNLRAAIATVRGGLCQLYIGFDIGQAIATNELMFVLPEGFRPKTSADGLLVVTTNNGVSRTVRINESGRITAAESFTAATYNRLVGMYFI